MDTKEKRKPERSTSISEGAPPEKRQEASPMRSYFNEMGEMQRESFSKILETTVDASCLPSCEHGFEEQLDVLMVRHCS